MRSSANLAIYTHICKHVAQRCRQPPMQGLPGLRLLRPAVANFGTRRGIHTSARYSLFHASHVYECARAAKLSDLRMSYPHKPCSFIAVPNLGIPHADSPRWDCSWSRCPRLSSILSTSPADTCHQKQDTTE